LFPGGNMKRIILLFGFLLIFAAACAPSQDAVQTAIAQNLPSPASTSILSTTPNRPTSSIFPEITSTPTFIRNLTPVQCKSYHVKTGDTCFKIASLYFTSAELLLSANPILHNSCTNLAPGQILFIPPDADTVCSLVTATMLPTDTYFPSKTPWPSFTPAPTDTTTPTPQPLIFKGKGTSVVDLKKWPGPALLKISYKGSSNFVIYNYDSKGQKIDLLVNTIGNYEGTRPIDFRDGEESARLQIKSSGSWEISVLPLESAPAYDIPGIAKGKGDDVFAIRNRNADLAKIHYTGDSNFVVFSYSPSGIDLLVNEIGAYDGIQIVPESAFLFEIRASGPWEIEFNTK
jgi:LysM repeat protein